MEQCTCIHTCTHVGIQAAAVPYICLGIHAHIQRVHVINQGRDPTTADTMIEIHSIQNVNHLCVDVIQPPQTL